MKFYRFWVKYTGVLDTHSYGKQQSVVYGASDLSSADAERNAKEILAAIQRRIDRREPRRSETGYEAPIREEVVLEVTPRNRITRNRYGAEVLNSETLIFADVDEHCIPRRSPGPLARLFGAKKESREEYRRRMLDMILTAADADLQSRSCIRIYETKAGFRVLIAGLELPPGGPECERILTRFHSDLLYTTLCRKQACCRARLTPKPSRIGQKSLRHEFPSEDAARPEYERWRAEYEEKSRAFAVCRLIESLGIAPAAEDREIIALHDRRTGVATTLPLA